MTEQEYKFPCYDHSHATHKWGIEYANDANGEEIVDVEWFTTKEERDQNLKGESK